MRDKFWRMRQWAQLEFNNEFKDQLDAARSIKLENFADFFLGHENALKTHGAQYSNEEKTIFFTEMLKSFIETSKGLNDESIEWITTQLNARKETRQWSDWKRSAETDLQKSLASPIPYIFVAVCLSYFLLLNTFKAEAVLEMAGQEKLRAIRDNKALLLTYLGGSLSSYDVAKISCYVGYALLILVAPIVFVSYWLVNQHMHPPAASTKFNFFMPPPKNNETEEAIKKLRDLLKEKAQVNLSDDLHFKTS